MARLPLSDPSCEYWGNSTERAWPNRGSSPGGRWRTGGSISRIAVAYYPSADGTRALVLSRGLGGGSVGLRFHNVPEVVSVTLTAR